MACPPLISWGKGGPRGPAEARSMWEEELGPVSAPLVSSFATCRPSGFVDGGSLRPWAQRTGCSQVCCVLPRARSPWPCPRACVKAPCGPVTPGPAWGGRGGGGPGPRQACPRPPQQQRQQQRGVLGQASPACGRRALAPEAHHQPVQVRAAPAAHQQAHHLHGRAAALVQRARHPVQGGLRHR